MITPEIILLSALASILLMLLSAIGFYWVKMKPEEPEDHQEGMYLAHKLWCDALDEAALSGDAEEYDRIHAMGWRRYSGTQVEA